MKLSEVAFDDIKIGMRVISTRMSVLGTIKELYPASALKGNTQDTISIDWDNGIKSVKLHHLCCSMLQVVHVPSIVDKYFNTQAMVNPKTPEEVKLVLEEVVAIQQSILARFLEIKRKLDETSKGNENDS